MKTFIAVACLTFCCAAFAKEVAGVQFPQTVSVEGKTLSLNGAGLRTKLIFKVYAAGLYVETPSHDAAQLLVSDQIKRVEMRMLRDLEKGKIIEAIEAGFEKNAKAQLPALKDRLARFTAQISDLKEGQGLVLTYVPGKGTAVAVTGGKETFVEGKDFSDALFSVWLGKEPVDGGLKKELLSGPTS